MFLIVGGDSEIGAATSHTFKALGMPVVSTTRRTECVSPERPLLDLSAPIDSWQPPLGTQAACVCAAVARLAACEADPHGTSRINVVQTLALVDSLLARGTFVLFLSTNQVFDGRVAHVKADAPHSPQSEYGRQKAQTETGLKDRMARGAPIAILRLAKVVSGGMPLIDGWAATLSAGKPVSAFRDMMIAPTPTDLVCSAVAALMKDRATGIFQLTGPRDVAYADVARFLADRLDVDPHLVSETSALEAGLPQGVTHQNTTLDSSLLRMRYGLEVPDAWQVIEKFISPQKCKTVRPDKV
jgi:dTDP-4-dehydrorhamnose reductase